MKNVINGFTLERKESYCGRCTPIIEWLVYMPNGRLAQYFNRKKDAIDFISRMASIVKAS
jgi:hypothetical protein